MLSIEDLREELYAVLKISEFSLNRRDRRDFKSFIVGDNLAFALTMAGEKVKEIPVYNNLWESNYKGTNYDLLLDYLLETTDLQDFNIQVCKKDSLFLIFNRKSGEKLLDVVCKEPKDVVIIFKRFLKDFNSWEEVKDYLNSKAKGSTLSDDYLEYAVSHNCNDLDDEILSILNDKIAEEVSVVDYDYLADKHVFCKCPNVILASEDFKKKKDITRAKLGMSHYFYSEAYLVSEYLSKLLLKSDELVVQLDDCYVWLNTCEPDDLKGSLKSIING